MLSSQHIFFVLGMEINTKITTAKQVLYNYQSE
jgi:hypothetical protein